MVKWFRILYSAWKSQHSISFIYRSSILSCTESRLTVL